MTTDLQELCRRCGAGEPGALDSLARIVRQRLYAALRVAGASDPDAEDFAQGKTLKLVERLRTDDIAAASAYVSVAADNLVRDWLRRKQVEAGRRASQGAAAAEAALLRSDPAEARERQRAAQVQVAALLNHPGLAAGHRAVLAALCAAELDRAPLVAAERAAHPLGREGAPRTEAQARDVVDKRIQRAVAAARALYAGRGLDP